MSRKTILTVIAVLGAIAAALSLSPQSGAAIAGLGAILVYVFFEAKADKERLAAQAAKFKDPKFWITIISAILAALQTAGVTLPISAETIIAVLTAIVGILFKVKPN
jgi:hypothetical protein